MVSPKDEADPFINQPSARQIRAINELFSASIMLILYPSLKSVLKNQHLSNFWIKNNTSPADGLWHFWDAASQNHWKYKAFTLSAPFKKNLKNY
jgi:hypothetical protein